MDLEFVLTSTEVAVFAGTFILTLIAGPVVIPMLRRLKFGQTIRDDGPATHLKKMGIPTVGGLIFIIPMIITSLILVPGYPGILPVLLVTLGYAAIGFIDDMIKVVKKNKDGLNPKQKSFGLLLVSSAFAFYTAYHPELGTGMILPFLGIDAVVELPVWLFIPLVIIVMYLITNSVNMTDGVDGLAAGVTLIVAVFFTIVAMMKPEWDNVKMICAITAGGCLGFLVFNIHPAKVIMGDTGSLALGGVVGAAAVLMKMPWMLLVAGAIYAVESLSVFIQVVSFKLRGKRVFKMAPIHHHFELSGWKETKVVRVFWLITIVLCLIGFATLRFSIF
ncbi:MAG: phospho-N-acetylmuramoyl-pentapeptide-transferase [Clostridiaceae bacterium]|jgi:phospho-N-acetylmuramoyl-pentapeptide-transferase|nr:phospho-N-acetylmuramoyl-pentapeptide-transferase [Bacillota bacterium]NLP08615.1 phospho-N-acetylmuramoyl-pentapeptide-transferase [Clostridiaceae bacterium]HPZ06329.1 phospho-N-acetylmuramoyl-pentapeptide-transferase [Clostridiales bacterium]